MEELPGSLMRTTMYMEELPGSLMRTTMHWSLFRFSFFYLQYWPWRCSHYTISIHTFYMHAFKFSLPQQKNTKLPCSYPLGVFSSFSFAQCQCRRCKIWLCNFNNTLALFCCCKIRKIERTRLPAQNLLVQKL